MRVHHLNCISTCLPGGRLMDGSTESKFAHRQAYSPDRGDRWFGFGQGRAVAGTAAHSPASLPLHEVPGGLRTVEARARIA